MSMMTPSPNAGCSTSSPMRSPRSWRSTAPGGAARPRADAASTTRSRWRPGRRGCRRRCRARHRPAPAVRRRIAVRHRRGRAAIALAAVRRAAGDVALRLDQLLGDLVEEPRRRVVLRAAEQHAGSRRGEMNSRSHRPGDADVGEPPLLLHLVGLGERPDVREHALLDADEEHDRELETLGRVQRHQHDLVVVASRSSVSATSETCSRNSSSTVNSRAEPTSSPRFSIRPCGLDRVLGLELGEVAGAVERRLQQVAGPVAPSAASTPSRSSSSTNEAMPRTAGPVTPASSARRRASRKGMPSRRGERVELGDAGVADAALGHVEDPLDADLVGGVDDRPQVGHRVLDLAAVVEAGAADDLVRHAEAHERLLDHAALGVGAVEHGDLAPVDGVVARGAGARCEPPTCASSPSSSAW